MDLATYLIKFFVYEFPVKMLRLIGRLIVRTIQNLGLTVMLGSFFKPLFGAPGFMSRVNGVVVRTLTLILGLFFVSATAIFLLSVYVGVFILPLYLIYTGYYLYALLFIAIAALIKVRDFYFKPIRKIHDFTNRNDYYYAGDVYTREIVNDFYYGNIEKAVATLIKRSEVKFYLQLLELNFEAASDFIKANIANVSTDIYFNSLIALNKDIKQDYLSPELLFASLLMSIEDTRNFLAKYSLEYDFVEGTARYCHLLHRKDPQIWEDNYTLPPAGGIDKGWAVSYTAALNSYGEDFTKLALKGFMPRMIGREDVKERIVDILSKKSKNNILIIGNSGSGKSTFIKALAREVALGTSIPALKYKRIMSLNLPELISGGQAETARRISLIIREVAASGDIILFIDEIQDLFSLDKNSDVLLNALETNLSKGSFQFIGTTSRADYDRLIAPRQSFANAFDIVEMRETTKEETIDLLIETIRKNFGTKMTVTYPALDTCYTLPKKYIYDRAFPDKAVQILMNTSSAARSTKFINKETVAEVLSKILKIPVSSMKQQDKEKLMNLEQDLHARVIGQEPAVKYISNALKRARVGVNDENKPIASFLFFGPTGVGKTETAKALAELYFGSSDFMIRIDMSEFQTRESIYRLIGGPGEPVGILTSKVKNRPYSLVLLDEIEKADKNVFNIFLQVLDDARLSDVQGNVISFSNTLIIMTSNVGTADIIASLGQGSKDDTAMDTGLKSLKNFYPPEFLNRFTALVPFTPLTPEQIAQIAKLKVSAIQSRLSKQQIYVDFSDAVIRQVAEKGYSQEWGARPLNRVIEEDIETKLADLIIGGQIKPGDKYYINSL